MTTIRFTADHFRNKANQAKILMDVTTQKSDNVSQLVADCIKVLSEEWQTLCVDINASEPAKGFNIPVISDEFYILSDGTAAQITRGALVRLETDDVIRKYGALKFLEKIDAMLDESIIMNQQRANDYQLAIEHAKRRKDAKGAA